MEWVCASYSSIGDPEKLGSSHSFTQFVIGVAPHSACDFGTLHILDLLLLVMLPLIQRLLIFLFVQTLTSPILAQEGLRKPDDRAGRQIHFNFPILNRLFGRGHNDDDEQEDSDR